MTTAGGGVSIINEETPLTLGIFVGGIVVVTGAAWRISAAITRATGRLERIEDRQSKAERRLDGIEYRHNTLDAMGRPPQ